MRWLAVSALVFSEFLCPALARAQGDASPASGTAVCTFADDKQISIRYTQQAYDKKKELPMGKLWQPGDAPMALFAETPVTVGKADLAIGAYNLYLIPGKDAWTLVVNKNVTAGSKYDQQQDLARTPMEKGELSHAEPYLTLYFGHTAAKQCSLRVDFGKTRAFVDISEQ